MTPKLKKTLVLGSLTACLVGVVLLRSEPLVNWTVARKLRMEEDPNKRIVLINATLVYDQAYWNPRYLEYALRVEADFERKFAANLIHQRFGTNGVTELRHLLKEQTSESARSNGAAVVSILESPQ